MDGSKLNETNQLITASNLNLIHKLGKPDSVIHSRGKSAYQTRSKTAMSIGSTNQ
jgi:hypothetical protein